MQQQSPPPQDKRANSRKVKDLKYNKKKNQWGRAEQQANMDLLLLHSSASSIQVCKKHQRFVHHTTVTYCHNSELIQNCFFWVQASTVSVAELCIVTSDNSNSNSSDTVQFNPHSLFRCAYVSLYLTQIFTGCFHIASRPRCRGNDFQPPVMWLQHL